jgi:hypothetical protein
MGWCVSQDWYDAIHWTIFKWNVNSLNVDDDSPDIFNWYTLQQVGFEEAYEDLEKGCQFNMHGYSRSGKMTSTVCVLQVCPFMPLNRFSSSDHECANRANEKTCR